MQPTILISQFGGNVGIQGSVRGGEAEGVLCRGIACSASPVCGRVQHSSLRHWLEPWNSRTVWWGWRAMGWTRELRVVGWCWEIVVCDWGAATGGWSTVKWMVLGRCGWA